MILQNRLVVLLDNFRIAVRKMRYTAVLVECQRVFPELNRAFIFFCTVYGVCTGAAHCNAVNRYVFSIVKGE